MPLFALASLLYVFLCPFNVDARVVAGLGIIDLEPGPEGALPWHPQFHKSRLKPIHIYIKVMLF